MQLALYDHVDDPEPSRLITLDPRRHRTYHYWHAFVPGLGAGQVYGFRAQGPFDPSRGLRFDPTKMLLDPYGRAVAIPSHTTERPRLAPSPTIATPSRAWSSTPGHTTGKVTSRSNVRSPRR